MNQVMWEIEKVVGLRIIAALFAVLFLGAAGLALYLN